VGNPGIALNEEGLRIADNYPVILLWNLAIKIQNFEITKLNDIIADKTLKDIIETVKEIEKKKYMKNLETEKIYVWFQKTRNILNNVMIDLFMW
jgi:hypothetical protein